MYQSYPYENRVSRGFEPAEQFSLNNKSRFALIKVLKMRSEVTEQKKIKFVS
jgi:hypothetical protein